MEDWGLTSLLQRTIGIAAGRRVQSIARSKRGRDEVRPQASGASEPPRAPAVTMMADLTLSTLTVGTVLFLSAADPPLGTDTTAAGGVFVAWCYVGGVVGRRHLGLAAVEGLLRLRLALEWVRFLIEAFGPLGS